MGNWRRYQREGYIKPTVVRRHNLAMHKTANYCAVSLVVCIVNVLLAILPLLIAHIISLSSHVYRPTVLYINHNCARAQSWGAGLQKGRVPNSFVLCFSQINGLVFTFYHCFYFLILLINRSTI